MAKTLLLATLLFGIMLFSMSVFAVIPSVEFDKTIKDFTIPHIDFTQSSIVSASTLINFGDRRIFLPEHKMIISNPSKSNSTSQVVPINFLDNYVAGLVAQQNIITNMNKKIDNNYIQQLNLNKNFIDINKTVETLKTVSIKDYDADINLLKTDISNLQEENLILKEQLCIYNKDFKFCEGIKP